MAIECQNGEIEVVHLKPRQGMSMSIMAVGILIRWHSSVLYPPGHPIRLKT
jgi:hypothetical protein